MIITCPNCHFSRDMPREKIPAQAVIATCPNCSRRFRFSPNEALSEALTDAGKPSPEYAQPMQDDTLPPGAVVPGRDNRDEDEDPRLAASRAYNREAARFGEQDTQYCGGLEKETAVDKNPWELAPDENGWPAAFYQTALGVMFSASRFFSTLVPQRQSLRALGFYLIVSVIQILVEHSWNQMLLQYISADGPPSDPQIARLLTAFAPQTSLAMTVLLKLGVFVLELYFFAALIYVVYRFLAPTMADFSLVFQVIAYSAAPMLLSVVPLLGSLVGFIWTLACIATGCRVCLKLSWGQTLTVLAPPCLMALLFFSQFVKFAHG